MKKSKLHSYTMRIVHLGMGEGASMSIKLEWVFRLLKERNSNSLIPDQVCSSLVP